MASTLEVRPLIGRRALETRIHVDIFHVPFSNNGMSVSDLAEEIANFLGCQLACLRICFNGGVLLDGAADLRAAGVCSSSFVVALVEECDALKLSWIDAAADGMLPAGTVFAGSEATGTRLALGRASHASGAHPGKCARELGGCRFGWGGNEVSASAYQVLVARDSKGRPWPQYFQLPQGLQRNRHGAVSLGLPCRPLNKDSSLPPGAFEAGYEADGTRLYAAAGIDPAGALCPGKLQRGWDGAAVGWGGCERKLAPAFVFCIPPGVTLPCDDGAPPVPEIRPRRYLSSMAELLAWSPASRPQDLEEPTARMQSAAVRPLPTGRPRVLHCHDMKGGYCKDADEGYLQCFSGWEKIDTFIYLCAAAERALFST